MIYLEHVFKSYKIRQGRYQVLRGVDFCVQRGEKVGILGRNGAGKSTLIRIISGAELPNSGIIRRDMSVSWPIAFGGGFQGSLTGIDNVRFVCRVYGADFHRAIPFVEEFSELGGFLREPVKTYSAGMTARLAFAISMAVEFDCFLIDEVIAVGDARFHQRCQYELFERRADRAMILVSHDMNMIRNHCDRACILKDGIIQSFSDMELACQAYATA
jgi:capsular polysaccharide transport system ATP-binding protein